MSAATPNLDPTWRQDYSRLVLAGKQHWTNVQSQSEQAGRLSAAAMRNCPVLNGLTWVQEVSGLATVALSARSWWMEESNPLELMLYSGVFTVSSIVKLCHKWSHVSDLTSAAKTKVVALHCLGLYAKAEQLVDEATTVSDRNQIARELIESTSIIVTPNNTVHLPPPDLLALHIKLTEKFAPPEDE